MKSCPFEFVKVEPLKGEARLPDFKSKFPLGQVPAIEDFSVLTPSQQPFRLAEGSAILAYLCEKNGWLDLYPSSPPARARVNEYLSHHHTGLRTITRGPFVRLLRGAFFGEPWSKEEREKGRSDVDKAARRFAEAFLEPQRGDGIFIGGRKEPSIADLLAYPEIAQMSQLGFSTFTREQHGDVLVNWLRAMEKLPAHEDVHQTVFKVAKVYRDSLASEGK